MMMSTVIQKIKIVCKCGKMLMTDDQEKDI